MHWCANLVCQKVGLASAVLLRALEPIEGLDLMRRRRGRVLDRDLCSGPGKLCQALGITRELDGSRMSRSPVIVRPPERWEETRIAVTPRIGITKAADWPLRFHLAGSPWTSRKETGGRSRDLPPE
jgi:DNA-3-methyladenine glycosylase